MRCIPQRSVMNEHIFQPGKIGHLELKNRIVYSAMTFEQKHLRGNLWENEIESLVYKAKQEHSPGLITFPGNLPSPTEKNGLNGHMYIYDDVTMLAASKAVKRVKINGCKTMVQCGGGKVHGNIAPSDMVNNSGKPMRAMTVGEIQGFIEEAAHGARLCADAGFDALEVHAGTGKILSQFLSPYVNQRTDQYGGSVYNRTRIIIEMLQEMRKQVGNEVVFSMKLTVDDLAGYLTIEEGKEIAKYLAPYLDAVQPSTGFNEFKWTITPAYFYNPAYMLELTQAVKEVVDIPVIAVGKLGNPAVANRVLSEGKADFISLGRPLYADPLWLNKVANGEEDKIIQCLACVNCMEGEKRQEIHPTHRVCTVNPTILREEEFCNLEMVEEQDKKKILVVGGGLAGMEASATLAQRGHEVTLCEKSDHLGGQWVIAAHDKEKFEYRTHIPRKTQEMIDSGVKIEYNVAVDKEYLEKFQPDAVVLATGAVPRSLPINNPNVKFNVVQGNDVIMDKAEVGERVVVIGARFIGMECADKLAQQGKHVSIVDMQDIGKGTNPRISGIYRNRMVEHGVYMYPCCPVRRFSDSGVEITHMNLPLLLKADTVVLAVGTVPVTDLKDVLSEMKIRTFTIGDCRGIGDALIAIRDGAEIARLI